MGHKDLGVRNYNPSLAAQQTKTGKTYLDKIRKLSPYERLLYWVCERHQIHINRFPEGAYPTGWSTTNGTTRRQRTRHVSQTDPPWTEDPILQTVFFCNPYRENDKVTAYLRDNFREKNKNSPSAFMGCILLRWYNYIPTMSKLIKAGIPHSFDTGKGKHGWDLRTYLSMLTKLRDERNEQLFGGAYIIRPIVDGKTGARKVESIGELLTNMALDADLYPQITGKHKTLMGLSPRTYESLGSSTDEDQAGSMAFAFARLREFSGMGKFYNYQFIGDLAYTHVLHNAPDWLTWGFCGPGTSRGLVRLNCPSGKATLPNGKRLPRLMPLQRGWQERLLHVQERVNKDLNLSPKKDSKNGGEVRRMQYIHMRDLCNCLCEYDKYERALFNERSIKRPYYGQGN